MNSEILGMKKLIFTVLSVSLFFIGCNDSSKVAQDIEKISLELQVSRFDREFASAIPDNIPVLRTKYPYLFPAPDSIWIAKMKDSLQIELFQEVDSTFNSFKDEEAGLTQLFKHIKYYFPEQYIPRVVTVTNDVDYNNRIILTDSLLFIGLDNYLGSEHKYYVGFQRYIAKSLDRTYMVSDVASAFAKKVVPKPRDRTFLARMIYFGKELYLKDKLMPTATDMEKIGYTKEELDWAIGSEEPIWRNFVEQEHLYSTDNELNPRFLDPAPFSKFGLELDNESPGRLGRYIGWQIIKAFMDNNAIGLKQMLTMPKEEIFKKSNYKPRN
ncbi:MAG: gliding motility-associated lipoprotein GldB [Maribacter sp.]|jgi:gliding motility-associated lipoprotein GldB